MASYRIISPTLWQDPEFRQLSPMAGYMLVQLRLMATNIIALYKPDWELIGELTRLDRAGRKAALAELGKPKASGSPWVLHEDGYAWIVNGFRHEFGFSDNGLPRRPSGDQIKAVQRALAGLPRHVTLIQQFATYYTCPDYPELDRVLTPYRQGVDTPLTHPARETGSGTGSGTGNGNGREIAQASPDGLALAQLLISKVRENHPRVPTSKLAGSDLERCLLNWATEFDAYGKTDKKTRAEYEAIIAWTAGHDFWRGQIRSPGALRIRKKGKDAPVWVQFYADESKDPKADGLRIRAERCLRDNPGCDGHGGEEVCGYCAKTVKGSKR